MFQNKRINLLLILVLSLALVLVGCGDKGAEDKNKTNNDEVSEVKDNEKDDGEKRKLVVGTSGAYAPWAYQESDELKGFEIAVWEEIAKRNNYEIEYKLSKFSGLMGMLDANQIDSVAHQMSITPEREEKYLFTEPYAYSHYDFVVKEDSDIKTLEDLKGKKVGCWLGGNGEATLRQVNEDHDLNLEIVTYDGAPLETEVELDRIDALWQGEVKTKTIIEQEDLDLRFLGERLAFEVNAYPFNKDGDNADLLDDITATIKEMREDGTLKKLSEEWFGLDTTEKPE